MNYYCPECGKPLIRKWENDTVWTCSGCQKVFDKADFEAVGWLPNQTPPFVVNARQQLHWIVIVAWTLLAVLVATLIAGVFCGVVRLVW